VITGSWKPLLILLYADDTVLMAESPEELQMLLDALLHNLEIESEC